MNEQTLFEKFTSQLSSWSKTGKEPELGDWNIRAYLDLQEQRLKEKGLERKFDYTINGKVYKVGNFALGQILNSYNKRLNYAYGSRTISYEKNGKILYKEKSNVPLYQLVKWPETDRGDWKKETYVCPNCSNIETVESFEENGCQYCGTHFTVSEMYPKVTNFYTLDNVADKKLNFDRLWRLAAGALLPALLIALYIVFTEAGSGFGMTFLISFIICFLLGLWFSPMIFSMVEYVPVSLGITGEKNKITSALKKYDETFSYDYFEGKALSLLRMIIFAKDLKDSVQYRGGELAPAYRDIVDMNYRGGLNVTKIEKNGEYIEVTLKVYMKNTYFVKGKCRKKNDTMYVHMRHNCEWKVEPDFSIVKVACHGCGGSFDATKHRCCPYCQNKYNAGRDDWEVLEIYGDK